MEVCENCTDQRNNRGLNKIVILIFFRFYWKINGNQYEIVVEETYRLHPHEHFKILNLTFEGRNLVTIDQLLGDLNRFLHKRDVITPV